ncbi:MAG: alpha-glucan phosphorylase, partial [Blastocatellia bacterium]|nr:alpha-glucan phosphorylase [Blastocatellia bacterium]
MHNSLPIYSGGLGILAGDHLKSASDMNVPLVAIGLFYRYGYFRQKIAHDGWQEERYFDSFENEMALEPIFDEDGERLKIVVHMRGRNVFSQVWLAKIGRISLYLLDTNIGDNQDVDRFVTGHLYGGDTETQN